MYLIKSFYNSGNKITIEDGIRVTRQSDELIVSDSYWGESDIQVGASADFSKLKSTDDRDGTLLTYVSEYIVQDLAHGLKKIWFYVDTYQPEKKEGYIIFINRAYESIRTNGQKIFGRYQYEIVALLKEGEYLEFDGNRIEFINNKLMLVI